MSSRVAAVAAPGEFGSAAGVRIVRDIARAGIAGLIVGVLVGGIGSRVAMRVIALLVPEATDAFTENGFRIGRITMDGTLGLILFGGMLSAVFVAMAWVVIGPWLPARIAWRALSAIPVALAFGAIALIDRRNEDFVILGHDPLVVVTLLVLVALFGAAMAVTDAWLDRRLPRLTDATSPLAIVYGGFAAVGALISLLLVVGLLADPRARALAITIVVLGGLTLARWALLVRGRPQPPVLASAARGLLVIGCLAGVVSLLEDVRGALGIR